ncbi:uncharacterized protein RHOBADRAFT_55126 [Rhodotorula graminis WP1]|uniref:F-box domain-containing protein n=1 Tax=Rhodotorula graminis (strain WP1) TaxID=578459 RepID=A0A0P9FCF1_RHOGW|nr:uncharacterized protein RHOBADRAFT_55126 [Rhodotorula graminis WP1]KPV73374.1 hypothetical protein RHOBADRAFT_55126 [Rhodotorula graminis WP1]
MAPTTIRDLPFELVELILEFASSDYDLDSAKAASARSLYLRTCATISRQWRSPAQAVLWARIRIHSPAVAKKVLGSPVLGLYGTRYLDLAGVHAGHDGLSGTTAARVLAKIRGVRWLRLGDFGRLSARVLQSDNLAGLRTLHLATSFPDKPATIAALHFPFHLRSLTLFNRSYGATLLPTLLTASRHTLTSLTLLTGATSPSYPSLARAFPSIAPSLVRLSLQHRPSPALVDHFALLGNLEHLECHFAVDLASVLDALPAHARLRTLELELDYNLADVAALLVARLVAPSPSPSPSSLSPSQGAPPAGPLAHLARLRIPRAPRPAEFREFGGALLLDVCRERGIEVEVSETVAWRTRLFAD